MARQRRMSPIIRRGPERTCIVTREAGPAEGLVRLVAGPDARVEVDYRGKAPGRGAWISPVRSVIEAAEARPALVARALELPSADTNGLLERVRAANRNAVLDLLSLSARAGAVHGGAEAVRDAIRGGKAIACVIAEDASPQSVQDTLGGAEVPRFVVPLDRVALGLRVGKGPRAVLALAWAAATRALVAELRRMDSLR